MATLASKYQIPVHSHDLTNILSSSQSQKMSLTRKEIVDFNDIDLNTKYKYDYVVKVGGNNVQKTLSFKVSDNLFDDLCIIERQILNEISNRESEINRVFTTHASMDEYGNIKVGQNSGLNIVDGVLSADFSSLQQKLVSGQNIKKIKIGTVETDLLINSDEDEKFIPIVTPTDLTSAVNDLNERCNSIETVSEAQIMTIQSQFAQYSASLANIQGQVIDILADLNSFYFTENSSATTRITVCPGTVKASKTCDNVVLNSSKSYYRKSISEPLDSCVAPDSTGPWFGFDTHDLTTVGQDYIVVKFDLDMEYSESGSCPNPIRFPWKWIDSDGCLIFDDGDKFDDVKNYTPASSESQSERESNLAKKEWALKLEQIFDPENTTNVVVEIRGYWKCDIWNWFGKLAHVYKIKCYDDQPKDVPEDDESDEGETEGNEGDEEGSV